MLRCDTIPLHCSAGRISHVQGRDPAFQCPYIRIAWSYCEFGDLLEGMRRLGAALRDCLPK